MITSHYGNLGQATPTHAAGNVAGSLLAPELVATQYLHMPPLIFVACSARVHQNFRPDYSSQCCSLGDHIWSVRALIMLLCSRISCPVDVLFSYGHLFHVQSFSGSAQLFSHCVCTLLVASIWFILLVSVNDYSINWFVYSSAVFVYSKQFSSHSSHFFLLFQIKTADNCSMLSVLG